MKLSTQGAIDLIVHEGVVLRRYLDAVDVWTYGVGHTAMAGPPDPRTIREDTTIEEALRVFLNDMEKYEKPVRELEKRFAFKQHQYDALVSFTFNLGEGNLRTLTRNRNLAQVSASIPRYNRAGGRVHKGLVTRRGLEKAMFDHGRYAATDGRVAVIPVDKRTERPIYRKGQSVDIRPYFAKLEPKGDAA